MSTVKAYASLKPAGPLEPFEYDAGPLGPRQVDVDVRYCGVCHSDLSMLDNEWGMSAYPFVPGHEAVGTISAVGEAVTHLKVGQTVGVGWYSASCMTCHQCMSGNHNLCPNAESTIVGRHGGFADKIRASWEWVMPLPDHLNPATTGPLFCGGITVFNPIMRNHILPTAHVGVVGIGGLGHMAIKFLKSWGCEVTAFSTSADKEEEARGFGAHNFVNTKNPDALKNLAGSFDLILSTVNVSLDWNAYIAALKPQGKLHVVGAAPSVEAALFPMLIGEKSFGSSPLGSPSTIGLMLDFCARHSIEPTTEFYPISKVNDAIQHLRDGKARYRIVLEIGK